MMPCVRFPKRKKIKKIQRPDLVLQFKNNFYHFRNHVLRRNDWKVNEMAKNILGENDQIYKNGPGEANGIGDGMYDVHHKLLRYIK